MKCIWILAVLCGVVAWVNAEQLRGLAADQCGGFPITNDVLAKLQGSATFAEKCETRLGGVVTKTTEVHNVVIETQVTVNKLTGMTGVLNQKLTRVTNAINGILKYAKRIPKVGKVLEIGMKILGVIQKTVQAVDKQTLTVRNAIGKVELVVRKTKEGLEHGETAYGTIATASSNILAAEKSVMECASQTEDCDDNTRLELENAKLQKPLAVSYASIQVCENSFVAIDETMTKVSAAIKGMIPPAVKEALDEVEKALTPVLTELDKIITEIKEAVTEAYCCYTPVPIQFTGELFGKVVDVVTCLLDGLFAVLEEAVSRLVGVIMAELKDPFMEGIRPIVESFENLLGVNLDFLQIDNDDLKIENRRCRLSLPDTVLHSVEPVPSTLLSSIETALETVDKPAFDVLGTIKDVCDGAVDELVNFEFEDCCLDFMRPLNDGEMCDPTGFTELRCTRCSSKYHEWWLTAGISGAGGTEACGKETACGKDGTLCGEGTTCGKCCNKATYWWTKAMTACGNEPCFKDGTVCAGGACDNCCNSHQWWHDKGAEACGVEPCWADGRLCGDGTTCKACCNSYSYWYSKGLTACGKEECWKDGTACLPGTSCKACCSGSSYDDDEENGPYQLA